MEFNIETFSIGDLSIKLYCSKAVVTDYYWHGLVVWPSSQILSWYIYTHPEAFRGKQVLELGSGCGLCGFVAEKCGATSVVLSDGNMEVLGLAQKTIEFNNLSADRVKTCELIWDNEDQLNSLINEWKMSKEWPTVILGSSVYHTSIGSPMVLWKTVRRIFEAAREDGVQDDMTFYTCFGLTVVVKEDLIRQCAEETGFLIEKPCIRDMLPEGVTPDDFTKTKLRLFKCTLSSSG